MTRFLFSAWQLLLYVGRPLWREDGSVIDLYNCLWALPEQLLSGPSPVEHTTVFYSLIWDSPGPRIYIPQEQVGPVIPPGTGFPFLQAGPLARLMRRANNGSGVSSYFATGGCFTGLSANNSNWSPSNGMLCEYFHESMSKGFHIYSSSDVRITAGLVLLMAVRHSVKYIVIELHHDIRSPHQASWNSISYFKGYYERQTHASDRFMASAACNLWRTFSSLVP
jgi:hypothetical protein